MLRFTALAGGYGMLSSGVATGTASRSVGPDDDHLGDFESGLDGWTTNGGNDLRTVRNDEVPAGVVSGRRALGVRVTGDAFPMIENKKRVRNADLLANPHLRLHVIGAVRETGSDLVFQFRLHHTATGGGGNGDRNRNSKDMGVVESEPETVPQVAPRTLSWDMSDLPDDVLRTAGRLEVVWHVDGHEPEAGPRGRATGDFDYRGVTVFDDIRLSPTGPDDSREVRDEKMALHHTHGMLVDRTFEELTADVERGMMEFADGTTVPYSFEVLDDDRFLYVLDGERFELGGGWE